jgi:signal transduction histidine kinase
MKILRGLVPRTIAAQITCIVMAAVLVGVGLASGVVVVLFSNSQATANQDIMAAARAARIAAIVHKAEAFRTSELLAHVLESYRSPTLDIQIVPLSALAATPVGAATEPDYIRWLKADLEDSWGLVPLSMSSGSDRRDTIVIKINNRNALAFEPSPHTPLHNVFLMQTIGAIAIVVFVVLFLSLYALRAIIAPLSSIASAARSFGKSTTDEEALRARGPREIEQVAEALNDMRRRVRSLVNERTQMLLAISHDLRTPLTRLRLRAERLSDVRLRENMLSDIATINEMLGETLAYLREGGPLEPAQLVEFPSLLQTICAQFTDIGHTVSYSGPDRIAFACRVNAVTRAITNLVDNGTKYGGAVTVDLARVNDGAVRIDVSDDGPGIPAELRERVFEPFFKGDSARNVGGRGGFGLGLSIAREIVRRHGGDIQFVDRGARGLTVRVILAHQPVGANWAYPAAEAAQYGT